jgi:hypothetical protein
MSKPRRKKNNLELSHLFQPPYEHPLISSETKRKAIIMNSLVPACQNRTNILVPEMGIVPISSFRIINCK